MTQVTQTPIVNHEPSRTTRALKLQSVSVEFPALKSRFSYFGCTQNGGERKKGEEPGGDREETLEGKTQDFADLLLAIFTPEQGIARSEKPARLLTMETFLKCNLVYFFLLSICLYLNKNEWCFFPLLYPHPSSVFSLSSQFPRGQIAKNAQTETFAVQVN